MVVLVANANVLLNPSNFKFISRRSIFREHAGLVVKHFSSFRRGRNTLSEVIIDSNLKWMEVYLSSSIWFEISEETPWKSVAYETYPSSSSKRNNDRCKQTDRNRSIL